MSVRRPRRAASSRRRPARRPAPALRLPRPGRRTGLAVGALASVAIVVLVGRLGLERLAAQPWLAVRTVEIEGAARIAPSEILERARVGSGDRWLGLPGRTIRFRIEGHPWVREARVRRPWPGRVRIEVEERVPLARVRVNGKVYGLSGDLRVLPRLAPTDSLLPEILGDLDDDVLARGVRYAAALHDAGIAGREPLELRLSGHPPDLIELPRRGFSVRVEPAIEPGDAVRNVAAFLETLDETGAVRGTLRLISVETAVWKAAA